MLINNNNGNQESTPEEVSENLRSVVLAIISIQSKLLSLRNENREVLNKISEEAIQNTFVSKDLDPADFLVGQFSEIEKAAIELIKDR
ncbi:MAG: hypothetical protein AAFS12_00135 [Cyanobacteria bacterium J06632_19]